MKSFVEFLEQTVFSFKSFNLTIERIILAVFVLFLGVLLFQIIRKLINRVIYKNDNLLSNKKSMAILRFSRFIILLGTTVFFLKALGFDTSKVIGFALIKTESITFSLYHLIILYAIYFGTRLFLFVLEIVFNERIKQQRIEQGKGQSVFQIVKYFIWVIAITLFIDSLGFSVTLVIASLSALLVGLGLGIQHFFNDIVSGIVILFDRSIKIGDIVEIQGEMVGKIEEISLRTSKIISRDDVVVIVPNSMFTSERVINWSHNTFKTRFSVSVGVAYGSDIEKVKSLLIETAVEHPKIDNKPEPYVLFSNFGDSSLDFVLQFHTEESFRVERIKSDLRFVINEKFNLNGVTIPFPQHDIHVKQNA